MNMETESIRQEARERLEPRKTVVLLWAADGCIEKQRQCHAKLTQGALKGTIHLMQPVRDALADASMALDLICDELERRDPVAFARWMDAPEPSVERWFGP